MRKLLFILTVLIFASGFQALSPGIFASESQALSLGSEEPLNQLDAIGQRFDIPFEAYYDSGLQTIAAGATKTFYHDLGDDPSIYFVYVYGYNSHGYHHGNYGTTEHYQLPNYRWMGLEWQQLTPTSITVHRAPDDDDLGVPEEKKWDMVRVLILKPGLNTSRGIPYMAHRAKLFSINPGDSLTYNHYLGGDPGQYMIYLYGYNSKGLHHANYGTNAIQFLPIEKWVGAEWQELTPTSIKLIRAADDDTLTPKKHWDTFVLFMIRIDVDRFTPPYIPLHSAFLSQPDVSPGQEMTLYHGLGGIPYWYFIHIYGYNNQGYHQANYGTNSYYKFPSVRWCGSEWQELNSSTLKLIRGADDTGPDIPPEKLWDTTSVLLVRLF